MIKSFSKTIKDVNGAHEFFEETFDHFDLTGWTFKVGRAKRRLGVCKYRSRVIEVSKWVFDRCPEKVNNTVRHELAHAVAGYQARHGAVWKDIAKQFGAEPKACTAVNPDQMLPKAWFLVCPGCGWKGYGTYRKRTKKYRSRCCKMTFLNVRAK